MQNIPGSSCPLPGSCPDQYGTLPSCTNLAVPYVAMQQRNAKRYDQTDALSNGTLFPGLNLPFHLKTTGSSLPGNQSLTELQALEFVMLELGLYLDTHPDDKEALELYRTYQQLYHKGVMAYGEKCGPMTHHMPVDDKDYTWLKDPWPWDIAANKEG